MRVGQPESIEVWDPGVYEAKVILCEVTKSTWPGREEQDRFKWVIRLKNEAGEYTDIWHFTNTTLSRHPAAGFRPMARALLPEADLDSPTAEVDTDEMVGQRCRVLLGVNEEKGRNTVEKILAHEVRRRAPVEEPAPAPAPARESVPF